MKTKSLKIKWMLIVIGAIVFNCALTSCSSGKMFSKKMKYTYYKKVKAQNKKDSAVKIAMIEPENGDKIIPLPIYIKQDSTYINPNINILDNVNVASTKGSSSVTNELTDAKSAKAPGQKKNKVKRLLREKIKHFTAPGTNTKDANGNRGSVLGTIVLVLLAILLAYILIVLLFIGLMNAAGGIHFGGC